MSPGQVRQQAFLGDLAGRCHTMSLGYTKQGPIIPSEHSIGLPAQSVGLLSAEPVPREVACFLRHCPGLSKSTIGELLGDPEEFFLSVLAAFTKSFDFTGALHPGQCYSICPLPDGTQKHLFLFHSCMP